MVDYWGATPNYTTSPGPSGSGYWYHTPNYGQVEFTAKPGGDNKTTIKAIYTQIHNLQPGSVSALADEWSNAVNLMMGVSSQVFGEANTLFNEHWRDGNAKEKFMQWGPGAIMANLDEWMLTAMNIRGALRTAASIMTDYQGRMETMWQQYNDDVEKARREAKVGWLTSFYDKNLAPSYDPGPYGTGFPNLTGGNEDEYQRDLAKAQNEAVKKVMDDYNTRAQNLAYSMGQEMMGPITTLGNAHGPIYIPPDSVVNPADAPSGINAPAGAHHPPVKSAVPPHKPTAGPPPAPPAAPPPAVPGNPPLTTVTDPSVSTAGVHDPLTTHAPSLFPIGTPVAIAPVVPGLSLTAPGKNPNGLANAQGINGLNGPLGKGHINAVNPANAGLGNAEGLGANGLGAPPPLSKSVLKKAGKKGDGTSFNDPSQLSGLGSQGLSAPPPSKSGVLRKAKPTSTSADVVGPAAESLGGSPAGLTPPVLNNGRRAKQSSANRFETAAPTTATGSGHGVVLGGERTAPPVLGAPEQQPVAPPAQRSRPARRPGTQWTTPPSIESEWVGVETALDGAAAPILGMPVRPAGGPVSGLEEVPPSLRSRPGTTGTRGTTGRATPSEQVRRRVDERRRDPAADTGQHHEEQAVVTDETAFTVETPGGGVLANQPEQARQPVQPKHQQRGAL